MLTIEPAYVNYPVININYKHCYYYYFFYLYNYYSVPIHVFGIWDRAMDHIYKVLNSEVSLSRKTQLKCLFRAHYLLTSEG